ncbi:hypothetical protein JNB71_01745 [Rhizobium herbae]|uniref:DUF2946 domain-containing protein n=1 Tax=Rhizobium herbae TaxID=508661 RepID=A0ABS7H4K4_9HYPH|nr:DUF2946 family protein [Rhizobium herbae]MBW9062028.1 hypothetical protein [Rhizobium herbae]
MAGAGRQWQMMVRVLLALALLFLSFAHQPAFARQLAPEMAANYVLPDGTIADICFGSEGVDHNGPRNASHEGVVPLCDYCRLAASIALPTPPSDAYLILRVAAPAEGRADFPAIFVEYPRTLPQSRAPPVSI